MSRAVVLALVTFVAFDWCFFDGYYLHAAKGMAHSLIHFTLG